jgi:phosphoglycerate dehydrogenase-like enzyme
VSRPTIALAMMDGLLSHAFEPEHLERLDQVGELLDPLPMSRFDDDRATALLGQTEVLVGHWGCPTLTDEVMEKAQGLRLFAYAAGTVKWQVTDAVWHRGVTVTSAAVANAVPVAEYAAGAILLAGKGVFLFAAKERQPDARVPLDPFRVGNFRCRVGLVGASFVGRKVVELLRPTDLDLAVADPYLSEEDAAALGVRRMELDQLCGWCDILSLHAPDIPSTRHMFGAVQLAALHDGVTIINTARGALIDHEAMRSELREGRLAAVLDVTDPEPLPADDELRTLPNVLVTPHVAGAVNGELWRLADLAVVEVERFAAGLPPLYPVHEADLERLA